MIYLDNSATTFIYDEVLQKMKEIYTNCNFNPSSAYDVAFKAENELNNARKIIAESIKANTDEIIFTSGGSESNNTAILGVARANKNKGKHIITTNIEHSSVYNTFMYLKDYEDFDVTFLKADKNGVIDLEDLKNAIRKDTVLVSIMHVNNEIGSVNDIDKIGTLIKSVNPLTYFHTDCVQSYMKLPIDVSKLNVDLISVSAHKIHAPKGIGFLYVRKNVKILPLIFGGGQEHKLRAGTENVGGICGLAKAVEMQMNFEKIDDIKRNRDNLMEQLNLQIDDISINTPSINAPHILSVSFAGIKSEVLLHYLEMDEIYVSVGSACSSKKKGSRVMQSIGLNDKYKDGTVRISLDETTTMQDVQTVVEKLKKYVEDIRKVTKYKKR
ncbi:cysteine desulfurase [Peptostreptococcaceae bacterium oral taxon 081]|nr:cysteine desulfurase family protein [Peptoanaerobacter stomatis]NWO24540.1 cysteine desulfurase [Peptostreptococcaceae bacterium oral taxon 081]